MVLDIISKDFSSVLTLVEDFMKLETLGEPDLLSELLVEQISCCKWSDKFLFFFMRLFKVYCWPVVMVTLLGL
jgi:hypothetical protein